MIPIGIALAPPAPDVDNAIDDLIVRANTVAETGVAAVWLGQLFDIDAITAVAAIAREVPDVDLGTAVTITYPRHPIVMSSQVQTAQAAAGGRFRLGLGVSHRELIEKRYGYSFDRSARHLREYLEVLNSLLYTGEVDIRGETVVADTTGFPGRVPGSTPPQVLVAALGPAMLRVTGELADGTLLWLAGPRTIEEHIVPILSAAAAGRAAPQVIASLPVCVTNDADDVAERARAHLAMYDQFSAYTTVLEREGARHAGDVAIIGDEAHVERAILRLRDAGATEFIGNAWGFTTVAEHDRTVAVLGALSGRA
ncbi:LLM class F420-dependent oxidoreductase [Mycolicibacterium sp. P9-64]|nr:LLM class F420-dependent oxidoreductase [Mycolicibacterium sp. P9-64]